MNKFEIVSGKLFEGKVHNTKYAGVAYYKDEKEYYKMHLNILPNITYFLKRNRDDSSYTIFSKMVNTNDGVKFNNPVGHAKILNNLKTHMSIRFDVLNILLFMSLFPSE